MMGVAVYDQEVEVIGQVIKGGIGGAQGPYKTCVLTDWPINGAPCQPKTSRSVAITYGPCSDLVKWLLLILGLRNYYKHPVCHGPNIISEWDFVVLKCGVWCTE